MTNSSLTSPQNLGVCVIVQNAEGKILLGKRQNSYKAGMFGLPGGRVEPGEAIAAAARREVREETLLVPKEFKYLGFVKEFQGEFDFMHFVFLCPNVTGEAKCTEPDKCEGWEWYPLEDLPTPILDGHSAAIREVWQQQRDFFEIL